MPKIDSIKKTLVLGSGPIIIGQAAEFDYSGTQACEALKEEGVEVVLINSNPATIMTDKEVAHKIYIEPLTIEAIEKVIEKERPDSLLAGMGGQTALNLAVELADAGILDKYGVKVIGTSIKSIKKGEDRDEFREMMRSINQPVIESDIVTNLEDGIIYAEKIGYPVIIRPAYTLGGTGGGIAENKEELIEILTHGLQLSPVTQVLIEKSIKGWKEIEYEVMRDGNGNCITVCNMENVDPVGVHTGDSIVVAPSQTLSDKEYQLLRTASIEIINAIEVKGSNYKNTCLYSILLEIKFLDKGNSYTINSLNLLDKTYSIGDIYIERVANGDELELSYNIGFTESMDKYYVQLINESGNIIDSLKLKNADYIDKVYYFINGKRVKEVKNLKPKDKLKILILFKDDLKKYNMFYFSPNIEYKTKYGNKSDVIPFTTYGEVKQDEILDVYKKLENNQ